MPDIHLCADYACVARGACLRYRAKPAQYQTYADYATARAGGACDHRIPVTASDQASGRVRPWQVADEENIRMFNARDINQEAAE